MTLKHFDYSEKLLGKINTLKAKQCPTTLGSLDFDSKLLLAPMASICNAPFRLLMEDLGSGGSASELISCHGIDHRNHKTMQMLKIDSREKNVGIQIFGEDATMMAKAAYESQKAGAKFVDINMGCPVKKVVTKGSGSALMKEPKKLPAFFKEIQSAISVPLTIKIRTGWDEENVNAEEICKIARDCGIEMVAVHGRTRAQKYMGLANWNFLESLAKKKIVPFIGNGDLHTPAAVKNRLNSSECHAFMIARGCLRNPFIFLESLDEKNKIKFDANDYWEVIRALYQYVSECFENERHQLIQIRKLIVWFAAGFPSAAKFRSLCFAAANLQDCLKLSEDYFLSIGNAQKHIPYDQPFMTSGHG